MAKRHPNDGGGLEKWFKEEEAKDPGFRPFIEAGRRRAELAIQVKHLREKAGLSQAQLAEKAGMHQPGIARIENGRSTTTIETLEKVASGLGMTAEVVFRPRQSRKDRGRRTQA